MNAMSIQGVLPLLPLLAGLIVVAGAPVTVRAQALISQAKANAGGVTPGDAPGFPVTLSRRGSYKLTSNLTVPAGKYGIEVTSPGVTIDLNGFSLLSDLAAPGLRGVSAPEMSGLVVRNGAIEGFSGYGIQAGEYALLQDLRIERSFGAARLGNGARVSRNTFADNGYAALVIACGILYDHNVFYGHSKPIAVTTFCSSSTVVSIGNLVL
jgi:hypothetical protein